MIREVAVVIGSNFGDCGKGLATQQFCNKFKREGLNSLVICHNGGSQRSHTIVNNGIRHAVRHCGAGSLVGCPTYFAEEFILNPIIFRQEHEQLYAKGINLNGMIYVNSKCRITTPFDMFLNDMRERKRNENRHGSCGLGIFETINREIKFIVEDCYGGYIHAKLELLKNYFEAEVIKHDLSNYRLNYMSGTLLDGIMNNYIIDLAWMFQHVKIVKNEKELLESYDSLVFEGAQGLLLDQNNKEGFPHLTPSNTGITNPISIMNKLDLSKASIEVCYITRSYLTRHGAGYLENECSKENINPYIFDRTNVPNDYQGTLRYGKLNIDTLIERTDKDYRNFVESCDNWKLKNKPLKSIMITHLNEYPCSTKDFYAKDIFLEKIYESYDETTQVI